jgi:hypothetical protein
MLELFMGLRFELLKLFIKKNSWKLTLFFQICDLIFLTKWLFFALFLEFALISHYRPSPQITKLWKFATKKMLIGGWGLIKLFIAKFSPICVF